MSTEQPSKKPISKSSLLKLNQLEEKTVNIFKEHFGIDLNKDSESIKYLSEFITVKSSEFELEEQEAWLNLIGAFLGQAIINVYGGSWIEIDTPNAYDRDFELSNPCVELHDGSVCFPFARVQKQLKNGEENSIYSYLIFFATYLGKNLSS